MPLALQLVYGWFVCRLLPIIVATQGPVVGGAGIVGVPREQAQLLGCRVEGDRVGAIQVFGFL